MTTRSVEFMSSQHLVAVLDNAKIAALRLDVVNVIACQGGYEIPKGFLEDPAFGGDLQTVLIALVHENKIMKDGTMSAEHERLIACP